MNDIAYKKLKRTNYPAVIALGVICLLCVIPVCYTATISFTDELTLAREGYRLIPSKWSMDAYRYILRTPGQILRAYGVSFAVTSAGTAVSLLFTSMLAYVIVRRDYVFSRVLSFMLTFTLLFNAGMVANYIMVTRFYGLKDTYFALIMPYIILPWHVFLMKGFLSDINFALIEAAKLDGCGETGIFFHIIVPISKPAFATVGLLIAFTYWNDWWLAMLYIESPSLTPLQYMLYRIMNSIQYLTSGLASHAVSADVGRLPSETARMAMCVLASWPMLFVFPFFQKYFVKGLTVGAVKG